MTHNSSPIRRLLAALLGVVAMLAGSLALPARADDAKPAIGKHYVIGTDTTYAPFEMRDPASGDMVGIDMDLLRAIAADQGFTVDIKSLGFDAAVQALNARQVDGVMAGMSITPTRAQQYDFTAPYFNSGLQFTSAKGSAYTSLDSLKGKAVAVKTGTAGATYANSVKGKFGFTTTAYGQTADMVNAVAAGQAAAYIEDYPVEVRHRPGCQPAARRRPDPRRQLRRRRDQGLQPRIPRRLRQGPQEPAGQGRLRKDRPEVPRR